MKKPQYLCTINNKTQKAMTRKNHLELYNTAAILGAVIVFGIIASCIIRLQF